MTHAIMTHLIITFSCLMMSSLKNKSLNCLFGGFQYPNPLIRVTCCYISGYLVFMHQLNIVSLVNTILHDNYVHCDVVLLDMVKVQDSDGLAISSNNLKLVLRRLTLQFCYLTCLQIRILTIMLVNF